VLSQPSTLYVWVGPCFRAGSLPKTWEVLKRLGAMQFAVANLATPVLIVLPSLSLTLDAGKMCLRKVSSGWRWCPSPARAVVILGVALALYYVSEYERAVHLWQFLKRKRNRPSRRTRGHRAGGELLRSCSVRLREPSCWWPLLLALPLFIPKLASPFSASRAKTIARCCPIRTN